MILIYLFKYISCYSLSDANSTIHLTFKDSNTSHVILYPYQTDPYFTSLFIQIHLMLFFIDVKECVQVLGMTFKYISCYSLSVILCFHGVIQVLFKYISCYSLSMMVTELPDGSDHSNTSHVILYLYAPTEKQNVSRFKYISCYSLSTCTVDTGNQHNIQIHLMLFFIAL